MNQRCRGIENMPGRQTAVGVGMGWGRGQSARRREQPVQRRG